MLGPSVAQPTLMFSDSWNYLYTKEFINTSIQQIFFVENLNWNWWLQAYPKISLQIFKHAAEDRPKPEVFNRKQLVYAIRQS